MPWPVRKSQASVQKLLHDASDLDPITCLILLQEMILGQETIHGKLANVRRSGKRQDRESSPEGLTTDYHLLFCPTCTGSQRLFCVARISMP